MSSGSDKPSVLVPFGLVCLAGAAALAWFSAPVTMHLTRTGPNDVTVSMDSRMFGLVPIGNERVDHVTSASLARSRSAGSRSHTPDRVVFGTAGEPVDFGRVQQLFMRDFAEIKAFLDDATQRDQTISSIASGRESRRFILAQLAVLFLASVGLGVAWRGVKGILA